MKQSFQTTKYVLQRISAWQCWPTALPNVAHAQQTQSRCTLRRLVAVRDQCEPATRVHVIRHHRRRRRWQSARTHTTPLESTL